MLLLVSGWPACGKTFYGKWLEEHRGFKHLEVEDDDTDTDADLRELWAKHMPGAGKKFAAELKRRHANWVLTWGAPAHCLPHLEALRDAGFEAWFLLPGSELRSRLEWLQHAREGDPDVRPKVWDQRAKEIRGGARDLRRFFRDRCIETLASNGERMSCSALAERMEIPHG